MTARTFVDNTNHTVCNLPMIFVTDLENWDRSPLIDFEMTPNLPAGSKVTDTLWHGEHRTFVETARKGWYVTFEKKAGAPEVRMIDDMSLITNEALIYVILVYVYVLVTATDVALYFVAFLTLSWATGILRRFVHAIHSPWVDKLVFLGMSIRL